MCDWGGPPPAACVLTASSPFPAHAEHARFLDALKLYGRQWRKIEGERGPHPCMHVSLLVRFPTMCSQPFLTSRHLTIYNARYGFAEHVGTKTSIQIRSHAQKFFNKLEKGAASEGTHEFDGMRYI